MTSSHRRLLIALFIALAILAPADATTSETRYPVYEMTVRLAPDLTSMELAGEIVVPPDDAARREIVLGLGEAITGLEAQIIDPEPARGTLAVPGELLGGYAEGWGTQLYHLRLPSPVPAGESIRIAFRCRGEEATSFVYHLGAPVTFAAGHNTAWYPQLRDPRDESSGWTGLRATGTILFEGADELAIYTTGRTDRPLSTARHFDFDFPVKFTFTAGPHRVLEHDGAPPVVGCFLRERDDEQSYLDGSAAVLAVLQETFGEYPHTRFAVVEVPDEDAHAAGFAGASLDGFILATSGFLDRRFNTAYFGHEIGHQWWGNLLTTTDDRGAMMFSEGMAQFGSLVAVESIDGAAAAERYRRTGYPGYISMQSGLGYLSVAAAGHDRPIPEANEGPAARLIADGKGFQVWNMLADEVGPERFAAALRAFASRHRLEPVAWDDFLDEIEAELGADLGWFYDQWLERTGAPAPTLDWRLDGERLLVTVSQPEPTYRLTVELDVESPSGCRRTHRVGVAGPSTVHEIAAPDGVTSVRLDPRYRILRWTPEYRALAEALALPTRARLTWWGGDAEAAEGMLREVLDADPTATTEEDLGQRFATEALLGQILADRDRPEEARGHLEAALRAPTRRVDDLPWVYFALGKIALELDDGALLAEAQRSVVTADHLAGGTGAPEGLEKEISRRGSAASHGGDD